MQSIRTGTHSEQDKQFMSNGCGATMPAAVVIRECTATMC